MAVFLSLLLCLVPSLADAMIPGQSMEATVVWTENGQLIVDRGAEDGLALGEYAQIIQEGRYKSRAVSLKIHTAHSLWGIYNAYEPLVLDKKISLKSSSRHLLTEEMRSTMNLSLLPEEEFLALIAPAPPGERGRPEESDLEMERRLKEKIAQREEATGLASTFLEDLNLVPTDLVLGVDLAPASFSNIKGDRKIAYRVDLARDNPEKNEIHMSFSYERNSLVDSGAKRVMSESRYDSRFLYEYGSPGDTLHPFSLASFERVREGSYYPIRVATNVGPVGLRYHLNSLVEKNSFLKDVSLSYIPTLDYLRRDEFAFNNLTGLTELVTVSEVNFRHTLISQVEAHFFDETLGLSSIFFVRPIQELDGISIDTSDLNLRAETEVAYRFHQNFNVSYVNLVRNDRRSERLSTYPETEITHRITVGYEKRF